MKYSKKVMEHFRNPQNVGKIKEPDTFGEVGNPSCGDLVKIYLKIDENHIIKDIKFQTFGCAAAIACSSMVTELAIGKHIDEAYKITREDVAVALDGLPERKMHCSNLGADALQQAINNYREKNSISIPISNKIVQETVIKQDAEREKEKTLDLQGKTCPMTFVYTKVALEELSTGEILKVLLDYLPAFTNVPESVKKQNLGEIIKENEENGIKTIWIKRK